MSDEQRPYLDGPTLRAGLLKWMRDLNAKNAALEAENAALRQIAEALVALEDKADILSGTDYFSEHYDLADVDPLIEQARVLLAKHSDSPHPSEDS